MNLIFIHYSDELQGTRRTDSQASSNEAAFLCTPYLGNVCLHRQAMRRDRVLQTVRYRSHKGDVKCGLGTVVYLGVGCNNSALNITNVWDDTVQIGRNVAKFRMNLP